MTEKTGQRRAFGKGAHRFSTAGIRIVVDFNFIQPGSLESATRWLKEMLPRTE